MTPDGFGRRRALAQAALWWEAVWPRLWPVLGVFGGFVVVALLDLPARLPAWLHALLLMAFATALAGVIWRGLAGFVAPRPADAERRLERDSGLAHRPLATIGDRPAGDDPAGAALWRAHQARAAAALAKLTVRLPHPGLARRDPRALRAALGLGLLAALVLAGGDAPARLYRAVVPEFDRPPPPPALRLEAWVTPPAYTGAAPVFLPARDGAATVPAGSRLQVAVTGGRLATPPELRLGEAATPFRALDAASFTVEADLSADTAATVRRDGAALVRWALTILPDAAPTIAFTEPPARAARGLNTRLPWRASDDWGLAAASAELRLDARPDAPPLRLDLTLPSANAREARGVAQPDLSAHPWAGLPVTVRLLARDGLDQTGVSGPASLVLPERSFNHAVAKRLIAVRKSLSLDPGDRAGARREIEDIARTPAAFEDDIATFLALRSARGRLIVDRRPEAVGEVQDILWDAAVALEEGRDSRTQKALQQAREALREALEQAEKTPHSEQRQEADKRIQELREAIRRHLEALAEKLQRENAEALPFDPQTRMLDQREIDRRTRKMQEANREGRDEDAKRELAELEEMLQALEEGRASRAENPERQQKRERGQQQMGVVQDMVKRQGEMLDRSHQRAESEERAQAEERRRQRAPGFRPPPPPSATPPEASGDPAQDGRRQRALRRALGELMQQFGDLTGEVPEALGRADQAMRDAQEALGEGRDARGAQQRAMRALQEGGRQMAQSMQRQLGQGPEGEGEGEPQDQAGGQPQGGEGPDGAQAQGEGRDPLGRRTRDVTGNADTGSDTRVPDEAEQLRTRAIQEELRRRGADRQRPADELDYIDRLLRRF